MDVSISVLMLTAGHNALWLKEKQKQRNVAIKDKSDYNFKIQKSSDTIVKF